MILRLSAALPVCAVSEILTRALRPAREIAYAGEVSRAGAHLGGDGTQRSCLRPLKSFVGCFFFFFYTAICGNATIGSNFLRSQVTLVNSGLKPGAFCSAPNASGSLNWLVSPQILNSPAPTLINHVNLPLLYFSSGNGGILVVQLDEKCGYPVPSMTTPSPNLNITQANTTTSPANTTSSPQNTTANHTSTAMVSTTAEATTESGRGAPCECVL